MGATKTEQLEQMAKEAARMDAEAKKAGFEDYAEYEAFFEVLDSRRIFLENPPPHPVTIMEGEE